jgi:FkbM family methyltransferase
MHYLANYLLPFLPKKDVLNVVDCGARSCMEMSKWEHLGEHFCLRGFEPDAIECGRLNAEYESYGHRFYPICLGKRNEDNRPFYVTKNKSASSLLRPMADVERFRHDGNYSFAEVFTVENVITLSTKTLNTWWLENHCPDIDLIKLDVQGAELEILESGTDALNGVVCVEVEVVFYPIYENQPLFADIDAFLRKQGFTFYGFVWNQCSHFCGRMACPLLKTYPVNVLFGQQLAGQLFTVDALYMIEVLRPLQNATAKLTLHKLLKLVIIAEQYGHHDYAFELLLWLQKKLETERPDIAAGLEEVSKMAAEQYLKVKA